MKKILAGFGRAQLAQLIREYMVASQFNSRTGYAALRMAHAKSDGSFWRHRCGHYF